MRGWVFCASFYQDQTTEPP
nr:unnamed protein product [Callosobruchus analis]